MKRREFMVATTAALAAPHALSAQQQQQTLRMRDLYRKDGSLSDLAQSLEGERITMTGYMAPPLKANSTFFVLTKRPMAVCPFCETTADWPDDIVATYTKRVIDPIPFNVGIEISGVLEFGEYKDPDTGFVSLVRLVDSTYKPA